MKYKNKENANHPGQQHPRAASDRSYVPRKDEGEWEEGE
jgi:hypothetical protein